ncbi:ABC transporter transmembrane domain-containing protein [Actinopolymorpha alba]|uniref:ABC transporter transmembrane domain-containing protein n=1 Tax=Actinopolymorpha alba TaxID=533267 RepID=UPI000685EDCC|nr:ABC transporter ATP-binding protein [Actinopolymorpha alba]
MPDAPDAPDTPDARGPARYLWWLVTSQPRRVLLGALWGTLWQVGLTVPPYLLARAIDDGLRAQDLPALTIWTLAILAVGLLNAILGLLRHRTMTFVRLDASYRTVRAVLRQAVRLGAALPRTVSAGEVVSVTASDILRISQTLTMTGPGVGGLVAYAVVAALLVPVSPLLAGVVLLGVPLLAVLLRPLFRRLGYAETEYREQQGALTARVGDIVAGLRVLCGVGGKEMFAERYRNASRSVRFVGYHVGSVNSWIQALGIGLPALFLAAVTWLAARLAAEGAITVGDLVAVYGYVAVLVIPVSAIIEGAGDLSRGLVAARRVVRILNLRPDVGDAGDSGGVPGPDTPADLRDPASGLVVPAGRMTAIAAGRPAEAAAIVDRLGRYADSDASWGEVPLRAMPLAEVRRRILVADNDAHLFAGPLREAIATYEDHHDAAIAAALHTAAADDVVAGLSDGLAARIDSQARNLSGGQRQRLRLARALLADPDILLLVEPTSAVDAHTEALIAGRVHAAREGRTTVVVSTSPLLLDQADQVVYVEDGQVVGTGTHAELVGTQAGYRALVLRGDADEDDEPAPATRALPAGTDAR